MTTQDRRIVSAEEARGLLDNKAWVGLRAVTQRIGVGYAKQSRHPRHAL